MKGSATMAAAAMIGLTPAPAIAASAWCAKARTGSQLMICGESFAETQQNLKDDLVDLLALAGTRAGRLAIEAGQMRWQASLHRACRAAKPRRACVEPRVQARAAALYNRLDRARSFGPDHPLRLGPAIVQVRKTGTADDGAETILTSGGKPISGALYGHDEIVRRLDKGRLHAALIVEGQGGTARCGNYAVVSIQPSTGIRHTPLTTDDPCADDEAPYTSSGETPQGLFISQEPAPFERRVEIVWTMSGRVETLPLAFHPTPATRLRNARPGAEPLRSADLFAAIERETGSDRSRFERAFWHLNAYGGPDERPPPPDERERSRLGRYGSRREGRLLVLRGCGWDIDHTGLWCGDVDALAVKDGDGRFFFAIRPATEGGHAKAFPPLDRWPKPVHRVFDTWRASPS